ncbi:MAG TPA: flavin reductase family protein [Chthoniobacteraceae bacterium]|jgi:flavin reductase (DIM6/NTAB) family NADH-FMN oxidoreductase RutF|nr:flavin reductase family protein [Chthoniobacteraceae bacterium]
MTDSNSALRPELSLHAAIAPALGKIASGLYVATAMVDGQPVGMLCSFVEQAGFEPPMITLAIAPDRPISPALVPGGFFGLHILGKSNSALMKTFARGHAAEAFTQHPQVENRFGVPQFAEAWAFLVARVAGHLPAGDHVVHLAEVLDGALQHEGDEPMVRVRANGFKY